MKSRISAVLAGLLMTVTVLDQAVASEAHHDSEAGQLQAIVKNLLDDNKQFVSSHGKEISLPS